MLFYRTVISVLQIYFHVTIQYWLKINMVLKEDICFERKVYRRILGPVYDNEKENWRILTNEEIYANIK